MSIIPTKKISALALLGALAIFPCIADAATPDYRDVVHDKRGNVVVNRYGNCVRTKWIGSGDECGAKSVAVVTERRVLTQDDRTVYFPFDQAVLVEPEQAKLDNLAAAVKDDRFVKEARIFGYADRIGSTSYNDKLSQRRAKAVQDYLAQRGVINTRVTETRWFGESNPITKCDDGLARAALIGCLQKDRRVEIEIDYTPTGEMAAPIAH